MTMNTRPRAFWLILVLSCMLAIFLAGCAGKNAGSASDAAPPAIAEDVAKNQAKAGAVLSSSAAGGSLASAGAADDFEDYGDEDEPVIADPLQPWNRFWFKFNDVLLIDVVKPVHKGYTAVVPQPFRNGISNVFHNLKAPVRIVNRLLQGEFAQMWVEIGRFIVNSTLGGGGLLDITKKDRVLVPFSEEGADFGTTLSVWGIGEGCYIVWPFLGPSTLRDTVGFVGDEAASPFFWGAKPRGPVNAWAASGTHGGMTFNDLGSTISAYETLVGSSLEPYIAVRDAYVSLRRGMKNKPARQEENPAQPALK